jgi:ABC-type spermidine/putrescine transport system permease subunit II
VAALIVGARAEGFGEALEEAAADLGVLPWRAFLEITLPLMAPAVIAGVRLAFTFSFDDVIISLFVQRPGTSTLPVYILSSFKPGLKGDVAAIVPGGQPDRHPLGGGRPDAGRNRGGALGGLLD